MKASLLLILSILCISHCKNAQAQEEQSETRVETKRPAEQIEVVSHVDEIEQPYVLIARVSPESPYDAGRIDMAPKLAAYQGGAHRLTAKLFPQDVTQLF